MLSASVLLMKTKQNKIKLSLYTQCRRMGVVIYLHLFLTPALDRSESVTLPARKRPRYLVNRSLCGPSAWSGLDAKEKMSSSCRESKYESSFVSSLTPTAQFHALF